MDVFTVSLFGHRRADELWKLENTLVSKIKALIQTKSYVSFLIGRNGDFDEYAASIIKRVQKEIGKENNDITLVLPYTVSNIGYYKEYYDHIIIPESTYCVYPKSAITFRNRWMIDQSDLAIFFIEHKTGGAYHTMKYAEKQNKCVFLLQL